jgi:hypothetical protein
MDGKQGNLRSITDRDWNPRSLSCDYGSASDGLDGAHDGAMDSTNERRECSNNDSSHQQRKYDDSSNDRNDKHDNPRDSSASLNDSLSDSERASGHSSSGTVPTREHVTFFFHNRPDRPGVELTVRLLNDLGATVWSDRYHIVSEAEYQQGFVNIAIIVAIGLVLVALGGKLSNLGNWMVGLVLAVFILFEGMFYAKNKQFYTYKLAQGGSS